MGFLLLNAGITAVEIGVWRSIGGSLLTTGDARAARSSTGGERAANHPDMTEDLATILSTEQVSVQYEIESGVEIPSADD